MSTPAYTKTVTVKTDKTGRSQASSSASGLQHRDYRTVSYYDRTYGRTEQPVDLFRQQFRLIAHAGGKQVDVGSLVASLNWQEQSSNTLGGVNSAASMTGTLSLMKPHLSQYKQLLPQVFDARIDRRGGVSRWGALGTVFVLYVGYARSFTPIWAMRVAPTSAESGGAESVQLSDGSWSLSLSDDLQLLDSSLDDFHFAKGKRTRRRGWRAHEIAVEVCRRYKVPIGQLVKGTAWIDMAVRDTTGQTPLAVIVNAYSRETDATGRIYIVRWARPTAKFPLGALEVVPMRRNQNLLVFREQLVEAVLTRSQLPDYATVVTGRATLKGHAGKHAQITFTAQSAPGVKRFGFIHRIVDFSPVGSHAELEILTKRWLAWRLTPLRTAEVTNPGVATIRRGDAVKIRIPEEGYANVNLQSFLTPRSKYGSKGLQAAQKLDPYLFGLPDPQLLSPTVGATTSQDASALTADTPVAIPVADQSIAFVTSATHAATAGTYTMDLQTSFIDILDPVDLKAEMEAQIRNSKQLLRAGSS